VYIGFVDLKRIGLHYRVSMLARGWRKLYTAGDTIVQSSTML